MADLLARIDHAVAGLCPCGAEPAPGSAYCGEDCRPTHHGLDTSRCAWRWSPDRDAPEAPEYANRGRTRPAARDTSQRGILRSLGVWRWLRGWWRRGVRRLTGRRFHVRTATIRFAVSPTAVAAALDAERHRTTLRVLLRDEAAYQRALQEARSSEGGLWEMVQRVAAGDWPGPEDGS